MDGWFLLSDVLTRLPLSIIVKAVKVSETCPELWKYLHHPVRKHFLIKNLPLSVRQIFFDRKYQLSTIYNDFRRLCFIGTIINNNNFIERLNISGMFDCSKSSSIRLPTT